MTDESSRVNPTIMLMMTPEMKEVLDRLVERQKTTVDVILRRAVALYKSAVEAEDDSLYPALVDREGNIIKWFTGL